MKHILCNKCLFICKTDFQTEFIPKDLLFPSHPISVLPLSLPLLKCPSHLKHGSVSAGHFGLVFFTSCISKYILNVGLTKNASVQPTSYLIAYQTHSLPNSPCMRQGIKEESKKHISRQELHKQNICGKIYSVTKYFINIHNSKIITHQ